MSTLAWALAFSLAGNVLAVVDRWLERRSLREWERWGPRPFSLAPPSTAEVIDVKPGPGYVAPVMAVGSLPSEVPIIGVPGQLSAEELEQIRAAERLRSTPEFRAVRDRVMAAFDAEVARGADDA